MYKMTGFATTVNINLIHSGEKIRLHYSDSYRSYKQYPSRSAGKIFGEKLNPKTSLHKFVQILIFFFISSQVGYQYHMTVHICWPQKYVKFCSFLFCPRDGDRAKFWLCERGTF